MASLRITYVGLIHEYKYM